MLNTSRTKEPVPVRTQSSTLGFLRCLVLHFFLKRFPLGFIPDETFFIGLHLTRIDVL